MKKIFLFITVFVSAHQLFSQNVGIGTSTPNSNAILDLKSSSKGILFPRLTIAQRMAITNPPDGLHVFNTDLSSLEYFDSLANNWFAYSNRVFEIVIKSNNQLTSDRAYVLNNDPQYSVYKIIVDSSIKMNLQINNADTATTIKVFVFNHGSIMGWGGDGGTGGFKSSNPDTCGATHLIAVDGSPGYPAIPVDGKVSLVVYNYGLLAGGGGGGGGGAAGIPNNSAGGGGGGGQTVFTSFPYYGYHGDKGELFIDFGNCVNQHVSTAINGTDGTDSGPGTGGNGSPGTPLLQGFKGGNGGSWGQPGQTGLGGANAGRGGVAGKAVKKNNPAVQTVVVLNYGAGIVYGVVD